MHLRKVYRENQILSHCSRHICRNHSTHCASFRCSASPSQVYATLLSGQAEEVISAAEAMPADKYNFAPTNGTFNGVRTFGQQVSHIASSQYYFSAVSV